MLVRTLCRFAAFGLGLASLSALASTHDATICFLTAERVDAGETLRDAEKKEGHEACVRALSATASVVQKHQFQEADLAITGTHHKF